MPQAKTHAGRLRHWLRGLEPRVLGSINGPMLKAARPWLDRHDVFSFNRNPLARGVAIGAFCALIPGPLQMLGTFVLCGWWRGNAIAGTITTFYTNPLTIVPLYAMAFQLGAMILPGEQSLPPMSGIGSGPGSWIEGLSTWVQALGWPLLVGLPTMGLVFAGLAYAAIQLVWLAPVYRRLRRMQRARQARG